MHISYDDAFNSHEAINVDWPHRHWEICLYHSESLVWLYCLIKVSFGEFFVFQIMLECLIDMNLCGIGFPTEKTRFKSV